MMDEEAEDGDSAGGGRRRRHTQAASCFNKCRERVLPRANTKDRRCRRPSRRPMGWRVARDGGGQVRRRPRPGAVRQGGRGHRRARHRHRTALDPMSAALRAGRAATQPGRARPRPAYEKRANSRRDGRNSSAMDGGPPARQGPARPAGTRPLGRDAAGAGSRARRDGRALRLLHPGRRPAARRRGAAGHGRAARRGQADRGRREGAVRGLPRRRRGQRRGHPRRPADRARPAAARSTSTAGGQGLLGGVPPAPEFVCCSCRATRSWRRRSGPIRRCWSTRSPTTS